jgi:hypothetical protein
MKLFHCTLTWGKSDVERIIGSSCDFSFLIKALVFRTHRKNPFTGKLFFNEIIFYHRPPKTLMTTDLFLNYPQPEGIPNSHLEVPRDWELAPFVSGILFGSRLWKQGMDKIYLPFYRKFMVKDHHYCGKMKKIVLEEWDVETLIPAHGDIIRGRELIRKKSFCGISIRTNEEQLIY